MKWQGRRGSSNIEDRRASGGGFRGGGPRRGGVAIGGGGLGLLAIVAIGWFFGVDLTPLLQDGSSSGSYTSAPRELTPEEQKAGEFVSVVLADTETVWTQVFRDQLQGQYRPAKLVLYSGGTDTVGCGSANAAVGPFYCPGDETVYLDTDFFGLMQQQLGAGGDFAFAYVVAHEIGHHVEKQLGVLDWQAKQGRDVAGADGPSVRVELMADCLAGIFAKAEAEKGYLDKTDIPEAMRAAQQIGDDTLQRNAGRHPVPDSFTHGTSEQRQRWFDTGYESGDVQSCNTIDARQL